MCGVTKSKYLIYLLFKLQENYNLSIFMSYGTKFRNAYYKCFIFLKHTVNSISVQKFIIG